MVKKLFLVALCAFLGKSAYACQGNSEGFTTKSDSLSRFVTPHPEEWNVLVHGYIYANYSSALTKEAQEASYQVADLEICKKAE
ncbi:hypothetical protein Noda2021_03700 [Candidatus Dependentiae bacterium Noda2021]|nr:hypothetical protein Noda2021_03700 [Candidatus Dependentiae bacterium Noda2021]